MAKQFTKQTISLNFTTTLPFEYLSHFIQVLLNKTTEFEQISMSLKTRVYRDSNPDPLRWDVNRGG